MDKFTSINVFGNLTVNGQRLTFEDFDEDNDGVISESEYNKVLKTIKTDSVELSMVDTSEDSNISKEEFQIWEQKILMQDAVNKLSPQISVDFSGKSQYLEELTEALKTLINDYSKTYYDEISTMAGSFEKELPDKYKAIKETILADDPSIISANVIYEMSLQLAQKSYEGKVLDTITVTRIVSELNGVATKFIQNYNGSNFAYDLELYLNLFLNSSDAELMADAVAIFNDNITSFGEEVDLKAVKEEVTILLKEAIKNGVSVKFGGFNILTENAISSALVNFTDKDSLLNAINEVMGSLNTKTRIDTILREEAEKAKQLKEQTFLDIKGSNYQVDVSKLNLDVIEGYNINISSASGALRALTDKKTSPQIYERGKGWSGSKDKAWNKATELLNQDNFKSQFKSQIESMLKEKGFEFSKIETVFENVYNQSIYETLNSEGMITGRGARGFSSKGKARINKKDLVDTFIKIFNSNIASAIDDINSSKKDLDIIDINYNVLNNNSSVDYKGLYQKGDTINQYVKDSEAQVSKVHELLDQFEDQLNTKAKAMCEANGIEFDSNAFSAIINTSQQIAVKEGVKNLNVPLFNGVSSIFTMNTRILVDSFLKQFKYDYTIWVDEKKKNLETQAQTKK